MVFVKYKYKYKYSRSQHFEHERGGTARALWPSPLETTLCLAPPLIQDLPPGQPQVFDFDLPGSGNMLQFDNSRSRHSGAGTPQFRNLAGIQFPLPRGSRWIFCHFIKNQRSMLVLFQREPFKLVNGAWPSTLQPFPKPQHRPGTRRRAPPPLKGPGVLQGLVVNDRPGVHIDTIPLRLGGGRPRERAEGEGQRDCLPQRDNGTE